MTKSEHKMTRQEFLKTCSRAVLGLGAFSLAGRSGAGGVSIEPVALGRTGIPVSPIGFGASRTMEPALVGAALDSGMNFLDTGRSYSNGQNEVMVGKVIAGRRKDVVIQSKLRIPAGDDKGLSSPGAVNKATSAMTASLEESLKALGTDYIDILLIHGATSPQVIYHEAVLEFFEAAKRNGKIRAHGFSSHSNQVELMKASNRNPFYDVIMVPYNHKGSYIHSRSHHYAEWDQPTLEIELRKAKSQGVGLVAMKTCSAGPLALEGDGKPTFAQALRWIPAQDMVHTMAVAMANFSQIKEDLSAVSGA